MWPSRVCRGKLSVGLKLIDFGLVRLSQIIKQATSCTSMRSVGGDEYCRLVAFVQGLFWRVVSRQGPHPEMAMRNETPTRPVAMERERERRERGYDIEDIEEVPVLCAAPGQGGCRDKRPLSGRPRRGMAVKCRGNVGRWQIDARSRVPASAKPLSTPETMSKTTRFPDTSAGHLPSWNTSAPQTDGTYSSLKTAATQTMKAGRL